MPRPAAPTRALVLLVLLAVLGACGDGGGDAPSDTRAAQARAAALDAGLGSGVADVLARAAKARNATYRVAYLLVESTEPGQSGDAVLTVTQRPPARRTDLVLTINGVKAAQSEVTSRSGTVRCIQAPESKKWSCVSSSDTSLGATASFDPEALTASVEQLRASKRDYTYDVGRRTIAGVSARCLVTTPRPRAPSTAAKSTLCVAPDTGVPLLIEKPGLRLAATTYRATVTDAQVKAPGSARQRTSS